MKITITRKTSARLPELARQRARNLLPAACKCGEYMTNAAPAARRRAPRGTGVLRRPILRRL